MRGGVRPASGSSRRKTPKPSRRISAMAVTMRNTMCTAAAAPGKSSAWIASATAWPTTPNRNSHSVFRYSLRSCAPRVQQHAGEDERDQRQPGQLGVERGRSSVTAGSSRVSMSFHITQSPMKL